MGGNTLWQTATTFAPMILDANVIRTLINWFPLQYFNTVETPKGKKKLLEPNARKVVFKSYRRETTVHEKDTTSLKSAAPILLLLMFHVKVVITLQYRGFRT
jgi:hypothetical protein